MFNTVVTFGVSENTLGLIEISFGVSRISVGFPISTTKLRQIILALCPKRFKAAQSGSKGSKKVHPLRPLFAEPPLA